MNRREEEKKAALGAGNVVVNEVEVNMPAEHEPMREQMKIIGLSEKLGGKNVSEQVKESDTLVKENIKE